MQKETHPQGFVIPSEARFLRSGRFCGARDLFFAVAPIPLELAIAKRNEFPISNPRRSNDENTPAALTLVPLNRSGRAAFRMVVLGTRRLRQPPRLLENHEEISRRRNSARGHRSFASL